MLTKRKKPTGRPGRHPLWVPAGRFRRLRLAAGAGLAVAAVVILNPAAPVQAAPRPNVVLIQTDDQPIDQFNATWRDFYNRDRQIMPNTMRLIRNQGIQFRNYITPFPLCAPSRATLLAGRYAQNTGVIRIGGARGGWAAYRSNGIYRENLPVWLQRAGYRTSHYGKFMNYYGGPDEPAETTVPPGWDDWTSDATDNSTREFYGYRQNLNGEITERLGWPYYDAIGGKDPIGCPGLGPAVCNYHSDSMSLQAADEIRDSGARPFYIQIDYHTPHGDSRPPIGPEPAVRHYDTALNTPAPHPAGFNEKDISDKPWFLRDLVPPLSRGEQIQMTAEYQKGVEALRSVDDGVKWIVDALRDSGKLRDTYIIFTSDNGFFFGQHRFSRGKSLPYEPAIEVPMVIRGPGIKPRTTSRELVANQDIAPTVLRMTGARAARRLDGRPMNRFWKDPKKRTRRPILLSNYQGATRFIPGDYPDEPLDPAIGKSGARIAAKAEGHNYIGIRVGPYKYVEYEEGGRELYMLTRDPGELHNRIKDSRFRRVKHYMNEQLDLLRVCKAAECRAIAPRWPKPK